MRSWDRVRVLPRPVAASIRPAASLMSASSRARVAFLADTRRGDLGSELVDAQALAGAHPDHLDARQAVGLEQSAYVGEHRLAAVLRHRVDVVEHDEHDVLVARQRREVAVVDRGVGVLLRVEHPHHQVGQPDQPVDLEVVGDLGGVVVGQVEEYDALEPVVLAARVEHGVAGDLVPRRDAQPLEQLVGTVPAPHARGRPRRGGAADADGRELEPGERVERGRLARPGGARDGDHGVLGGEPEPPGSPVRRRLGVVDELVVEAPARGPGRRIEPFDAGADVGTPGDQLLGPVEQGRHLLPRRRLRHGGVSLGGGQGRCGLASTT